jgi:GxxExxY protein
MNTDGERMNTDESTDELNEASRRVLGCAFIVANTLGCGFVEKVYENALAHELRKAGISVQQQKPIQVKYDGLTVGAFSAGLLVEESLLLELKATDGLVPEHMAQCLNYLRATGLPLCLLLNFGKPRLEIKRISARR